MSFFTTFSFGALLLGWTSLLLCLAPWSALGAAPGVDINGTSIVGTLQSSASNVTVEFFGGQYRYARAGFVARELTDFCTCAGIPFAEPPLGELRFAPPVANTFVTPTVNATAFGAACVQLSVWHRYTHGIQRTLTGVLPGRPCFRGLPHTQHFPAVQIRALRSDPPSSNAMGLRRRFPARHLFELQRQ